VYVTDTHPLVWYAVGRHASLSRTALSLFNMACNDQVLIYVPGVVLWEISILVQLGKIRLHRPFEEWCGNLALRQCFDVAPLDQNVICNAHGLQFRDRVDALIVATAQCLELPLITKDHEISSTDLVEIAW
jgi:PIN domain nuclease of toxin-antitoxin system